MPGMPNFLACPACQILWLAGRAIIWVMPGMPKSVSGMLSTHRLQFLESTDILSLAKKKKKLNRSQYLSFDVRFIGHLHDDVIAIPLIFIDLVVPAKFK